MKAEGIDIDKDRRDVEAFCADEHVRLVGLLGLLVGDVDVAEELAQDVLAKVVQHWSTIDDPQRWMHRVAVNQANSWWRRQYARRRALVRYRNRQVEPAMSDDAMADIVRSAVAELPRRQRTALAYRYYAGFDVAETATAMGCAAGTVRALTHQAMTTLRNRPDLNVDRREHHHG